MSERVLTQDQKDRIKAITDEWESEIKKWSRKHLHQMEDILMVQEQQRTQYLPTSICHVFRQ